MNTSLNYEVIYMIRQISDEFFIKEEAVCISPVGYTESPVGIGYTEMWVYNVVKKLFFYINTPTSTLI